MQKLSKLSDEDLLSAYLNALVDNDEKLLNKIKKEMLKRQE